MKKFKTIDFFINLVMIIGFVIYCSIRQGESVFIAYFVVGGWQVISMIVHALNKWFTRTDGSRYIYHWITFISVVTMPLGSFWILLLTAPFMAVFYTFLCYREVYIKMQRPMALLK